jgi:GntR family transcriptional regulator
MEIHIDPDSTLPIYQQIIQAIKFQVATGQLQPGEQLPTVRRLATDLRINPNTVARAYDALDTEGVITTQRGKGTYIREHPDHAYLAHLRQEQLKAMIDNMVNKALSLRYTPEEIKVAFIGELAYWVRQRQLAAATHKKRIAEPKVDLARQKGRLLDAE